MIEIKKVNKEFSDLLLSWRNHPEVYRYALNPTPIDKADHEKWLEKKLNQKTCFFYLGIVDGTPCGSVRYDVLENSNEAEVSISLAPEFWGKGIATELLLAAETFLKKESKVTIVRATVMSENKASMRLFEKTAYVQELTKFKKNI